MNIFGHWICIVLQKGYASGKKYKLDYKTYKNGFRLYGGPRSNKTRILIIGDSFTHAEDVSSTKAYYGIVQERLPVEVFSYGCGGYGSLQEYLILDENVDGIRPDIVVWQYCYNDLITNSYELEASSYENSIAQSKPYLDNNNQIVSRIPLGALGRILVKTKDKLRSRLLGFVISGVEKARRVLNRGKSVERIISVQGTRYQPFNKSVQITDRIMRMVRERCGHAKISAFSADDTAPYYEEFKKISENNGFVFMDSVPLAVREAEQKGLETKGPDQLHWGELGHEIVANEIMKYPRRGIARNPSSQSSKRCYAFASYPTTRQSKCIVIQPRRR